MGGTDKGPVEKISITSDDYRTILGSYKLTKKKGGNKYFASVAEKYDSSDRYQGERFLKFAQFISVDDPAFKKLSIEAGFQMYHQFIEHVYGLHHALDGKGTKWVVLEAEYVSETSLKDFFGQGREDDEKFCCMLQLAEAVRYYAEYRQINPFVHRDLKPENIMIESKYGKFFRSVIIDFDSAHVPIMDDPNETRFLGENRSVSGYTPVYSDGYTPIEVDCPENMILWDIYSLGRIFCYILMGKNYFTEQEKKEQFGYYLEQNQEWQAVEWSRYLNGTKIPEHPQEYWFGLQKERLGEKYRDETYKGLLSIIDKMTATQDRRYRNIGGSASTDGGVMHDLKEFFRSYYGTKYDDFLSRVFVETKEAAFLREKKTGSRYRISYYWGEDGSETDVNLNVYNVAEIYYEKTVVFSLYRIGEKIYYVPYATISREKDTGFELKKDCKLFYKGKRFNFKITEIDRSH